MHRDFDMLQKYKKYEGDYRAKEANHSAGKDEHSEVEFADTAQHREALFFLLYVAWNLIMKAMYNQRLVCKESKHVICL